MNVSEWLKAKAPVFATGFHLVLVNDQGLAELVSNAEYDPGEIQYALFDGDPLLEENLGSL